MKQYKPQFLGKVIPADDSAKLTDFCVNKYDAFNKIYDACKEQSAEITDVHPVEIEHSDESTLTVKVSTSSETMNQIKTDAPSDVSVNGDTITAKK